MPPDPLKNGPPVTKLKKLSFLTARADT